MSPKNLLVDGESLALEAVERYLSLQERQSATAVAPELVDFVKRISAELPPSHNHGKHPCHPFNVPADVQPLDASFNPSGEPFKAVTRDLSLLGIGLVYTRAVDAKYLQVTIRTTVGSKSLIVEVTGCRSLGTFYDIGATFVSD